MEFLGVGGVNAVSDETIDAELAECGL